VPTDISDNLLSQVEIPVYEEPTEDVSPFGNFEGDPN